ncbi:MAG: tripartite tricarboxylate transporter substrate binding protein [Alphaproteobacteria bacterium]|nr:tripartite tricarboxylate transporter substrate binding protein [Alphaproteobacteria bacterium]
MIDTVGVHDRATRLDRLPANSIERRGAAFSAIGPAARRSSFGLVALGAAAFALWAGTVGAQESFPSKPVTLLNPLPAGGGVDTAMRGLAKEMAAILGQPVLVESRPGAGGTIAGEFLAKAKPDGYLMGLLQSTQAIPEIYAEFQKPPYSSAEISPVVRYMSLVYAMPSRAGAPWKSFSEMIAYAKANPNKVRWGRTVGLGHPLHLVSYSLMKKAGIQVIEVPFKGAADAITALLGGHIDVAFGVSTTAIAGHVAAGRMMALAIHNPARLPEMPDVPTFKEQGIDPGVPPVYNTFFVPKGTPPAAVKVLHDAVKKAIETPALKEFAAKNGILLYYGSEADVAQELKQDREVSSALVAQILKEPKKE